MNKSGRGACPRSSNPSHSGGKPLFLTCSFFWLIHLLAFSFFLACSFFCLFYFTFSNLPASLTAAMVSSMSDFVVRKLVMHARSANFPFTVAFDK
jgi:hypothetical protein